MSEIETAESLQDGQEVVENNAEETTNAAAANAGEDGNPQATQNQTDDESNKPRKGGYLRKLEKAEQERDFWREEALRNRGTQAKPAAEVSQGEDKPPVKPKLENFNTLPEYEDAKDKYFEDLAAFEAKQAVAKFKTESQQQAERQTVADGWATQVAEAKTRYSDFEAVAFSEDVPFSQAMFEAVTTSELGADIAYELGKNPDESERIAKLPPIQAVREIGKIEARIAARNAAAEKTEETQAATSKAPRPPVPVRRPAVSSNEPEDKDDYKTWVRKREAQLKAR